MIAKTVDANTPPTRAGFLLSFNEKFLKAARQNASSYNRAKIEATSKNTRSLMTVQVQFAVYNRRAVASAINKASRYFAKKSGNTIGQKESGSKPTSLSRKYNKRSAKRWNKRSKARKGWFHQRKKKFPRTTSKPYEIDRVHCERRHMPSQRYDREHTTC